MLILFTLFSLFALLVAQENGLTVRTQQGEVSGTLSASGVRQFLGIPYATAGRWQAPQLPPVRKGVFKATTFGDSCVQDSTAANLLFPVLQTGEPFNVTESEDCLTVNIWSPSAGRKQNTAVLLWIYGGDFVVGTSNISIYSGSNFVRDNDDITIVTFNYRLNIFGQPNAPQLVSNTTSQNFGLLDLDAAVKWVHDNIASFGGDPNRISLFGQSAGSIATDIYAFAHPHDTIVKGIIQQSGSVSGQNSSLVVSSTALDPTPWNTISQAVGCGRAITSAQFTCMKAVPFRTLENAVISTNTLFNQVVDNIDIFSDTAARAAAGNFLRVPLLGGTNANEQDIFLLIQELLSTGVIVPAISEMLSDVQTLAGFGCSVGFTALNRIKNGVPVYRYQYQGIFPDISTRPELRAFHGAEIALVFGTYNNSAIPATPAEIRLSKFMQGSWVAFARDPKQGLLNHGWPLYSPNTTTLVQLGNPANQSGIVLTKGSLIDFACPHLDVLQNIERQLTSLLSG